MDSRETQRPRAGGARAAVPRVVIAVVTFKRPEELSRLLPLLQSQKLSAERAGAAAQVEILVVDNDPAMTAQGAVQSFGSPVSYVLESRPGVAAARNRALQGGAGSDVLVFIDDDETPTNDDWLVRLLAARSHYGADVVAGPVRTLFEGEPDEWITAGRFFARDHRAGLATGAPIDRAATNNILLDLVLVYDLELTFDDAFGRSGGEDSLFTSQLHRGGAAMIWCAEAEVLDHLPPVRRTRAHALRRTRSMAAAGVRVELALRASRIERAVVRLRSLAIGGVRMVSGLLQIAVGTPTRSIASNARGRRQLARGLGGVAGSFGRMFVDYGQPEVADNPTMKGNSHG